MKSIINKTYLLQSKKLIDEYNDTINIIMGIEKSINSFIEKISNLKEEFEKISKIPDNEIDSKDFEDKIVEYTTTIDEFQKVLEPYVLKIEKLKKESYNLYKILKDKYSHLSEEELKTQIQIGIYDIS